MHPRPAWRRLDQIKRLRLGELPARAEREGRVDAPIAWVVEQATADDPTVEALWKRSPGTPSSPQTPTEPGCAATTG